MKTRFLLTLGLVAAPLWAQPPEPRKSKPAAPPISLEEANKVLGGPTLITLHLKDATPQNIVKEFARVSGVAVRMYYGGLERAKTLSIDLENQPFWSAMRELCTLLGATPQPFSGDSTIVLQPGAAGWAGGAMLTLSPLVSLRLSQISHTHTFKLSNEGEGIKAVSDEHSLPIVGMFLFDPKVRPLSNPMQVTITGAVDEKGVAITSEPAHAYSQMPLMSSLQIPLKWRADMGKKLVRLRGNLKCIVMSKREVWEIPDVLNAKETSKTVRGPDGDEIYTFLGVQKTGNQYQVRVKIERPQALIHPNQQPDAQQFLYARRDVGRLMKLQDANGRNLGWQGGGGGDDAIVTHFAELQDAGEKSEAPQKLILEIPLEFRELEVPFELKDLPLP